MGSLSQDPIFAQANAIQSMGSAMIDRAIRQGTATPYRNPDAFLRAWVRGVEIAGTQWFGSGQWTPQSTKWDFRPDFQAISDNLGALSTTEAVFLAAMHSFFNPAAGDKLLKRLGAASPGALASILDERRLRVIADLMVSYEGW